MVTTTVTQIYFSPTNTTKKVVEAISAGISDQNPGIIDFTRPKNRQNPIKIDTDYCIVGVPVYSDKIPKLIKEQLKFIDSTGTKAVIVAVYGNREYGVALKELGNILTRDGVKIIAAGAFIGEHSYSTDSIQLAIDRPDDNDKSIARDFGIKITEIKEGIYLNLDDIPGKKTIPHSKEREKAQKDSKNGKKAIFPSKVDPDKCTKCKKCVNLCPVNAIDKDSLEIDLGICINCMACVKFCPESAREIVFSKTNIMAFATKKVLKSCVNKRKEPKTVLAGN